MKTETLTVPLMDPKRVYDEWGPEAERLLVEILRAHAYVKGEHVRGLEASFAAYLGVKRAVAVDSGTDALTLALRALLGARDADRREVVLPPFTFVATAGAVVNAGGIPVFADVDRETMNLAPEAVRAKLTPRTAVVIPVPIFGSPVDMSGLARVIDGRDVRILEDAAQAVGATLDGRKCGAFADAGTFSFYPSKNLGAAGDGGMVTTDDDALADEIASLRDHGQTRKLYDHVRVGTNSRMDEMQAAVLRLKLERIDDWTEARRAVARRYDDAFAGTAIRPQRVLEGAASAYHLYTVRVPDRDAVQRTLEAEGIRTGIYYPVPLHRQTCFADSGEVRCPVAEALSAEVLSLPCFPGLTAPEQQRVVTALLAAVA